MGPPQPLRLGNVVLVFLQHRNNRGRDGLVGSGRGKHVSLWLKCINKNPKHEPQELPFTQLFGSGYVLLHATKRVIVELSPGQGHHVAGCMLRTAHKPPQWQPPRRSVGAAVHTASGNYNLVHVGVRVPPASQSRGGKVTVPGLYWAAVDAAPGAGFRRAHSHVGMGRGGGRALLSHSLDIAMR